MKETTDSDAIDCTGGGPFQSDAEPACLIELNLRGEDGAWGADGESYPERPPGYGKNGRRGGDASPAARGEDADSATIRISYAVGCSDKTSIQLTGQLIRARGGAKAIERDVLIGSDGYVFVRAHGGRGGNGGRGGDGQPGSHGRPGADATRYSTGGNGGPGGDGGHAGNPTDGADGGHGGNLRIEIHEAELGLLMLLKGDLSGGDIGFAGEPGRGGDGGNGGPGGSSYHWTETEHYTDSQGRTQTRTVSHSNPGGYQGPSGHAGLPSIYQASDGSEGNPGHVVFVVISGSGTQREYEAPYNLELLGFDLVGEQPVLEPDSLVSLQNLTIRNCGGMPTPENYEIHISLASDDWIQVQTRALVVPRSLAAGEIFVYETQAVQLRVSDVVINAPRRGPFHLTHPIAPVAVMESGIHRPFREFESFESLSARFPVELTEIIALNSLAPGESTRVRWGITNVGTETFDDALTFRSVRTNCRLLGGDVQYDQVLFFDETDQPHDLTKEERSIAVRELKPGETRWIETRVGIRHHGGVVAYQDLILGVDLQQQRPRTSARQQEYRRVDYRHERIRISEQYRRDEGSRFLLIANQRTDVSQIEKWTRMADYFGSGLDIWDVSYYGFLDFLRKLTTAEQTHSGGTNQENLLEQWRGMTVIIPNNYFDTPLGKTTAFELLSRSQFIRSAADHGINFYIVGDAQTGGPDLLAESLLPINTSEHTNGWNKQADFLKAVRRWNKYVARSAEVVGVVTRDVSSLADASLGSVHKIEVEQRTMLFQPDAKWLEREAHDIQRKLCKSDPLHRWVIVHRYDTGDTDTSWGFFRKRKVGRLEVRRTLDSTKGSVVLYQVNSIDMIEKDFIDSVENKHGIFLTLKFEDKVDRFIRLVSERIFPRMSENYIDRKLTQDEIDKIGHELIESILVDLYNEQLTARTCQTWGPFGVRALLPKLNYLAERSLNYGLTFRQMQESEMTLPLLYELLASLRYIATKSTTIWDSRVLPTSVFRRSRAVSDYMRERVDRVLTNIFGPKMSWWDKWSGPNNDYNPFGTAKNVAPKGIARDTANREVEAWEAKLTKMTVNVSSFAAPQRHAGLTYDPEVLPASARVLSGAEYDQWVAREQNAELKRAQIEYAIAKQRSELLVPLANETTQINATQTTTAISSQVPTGQSRPTPRS